LEILAAAILAIGLVASIAINIWQYDSAQQLAASLSPFNEPLVLDSYAITEDAIIMVLRNRGVSPVLLGHGCEVNGRNPASFNQSASTVSPNGTVVFAVDGPILTQNASYGMRLHYQCDSGWHVFETRLPPYTAITYEPIITPGQATSTGREFLDSRNYTTGVVLSANLTVLQPDDYWHSLFGIQNNAQPGYQHCWGIMFEKACCPGHFYLLLINSETGEVIGGSQCL